MIKKLRNKGTGKIGYLYANKDMTYQVLDGDDCVLGVYDTLPRLIEEWEDYKLNIWYNSMISGRYTIEIGFTTDKEAKEALEKLKAFQRLKDKGFRFNGIDFSHRTIKFKVPSSFFDGEENIFVSEQSNTDLKFLFGDEE